jgi:hypothetical protein
MLRQTVIAVLSILAVFNGSARAVKREVPNPIPSAAQTQEKKLEHFKLFLRTVGEDFPKTNKGDYGSNQDVWVQMLATNSSSQVIVLSYSSLFVHYLPKLSLNGVPVPYSKSMQKRLADSRDRQKSMLDPNALVKDSYVVVKLPPNQQSEAGLLNLSSYYDPLQSGVYELKVEYRELDESKIESDAVTFVVLP